MFWIHRTRLFWFGLAVLVVMAAMLVVTCKQSLELKHWRTVYSPSRAPVFQRVEGGLEGGGVFFAWQEDWHFSWGPKSTGFFSRWRFSSHPFPGFVSWPRWESDDTSGLSSFSLHVPIWPAIVLWCFLWPWWMHRSEKKMVERYRTAEDGDPAETA